MKAALYVRVSTDDQAEEGYSIDAQKNQLTDYCKKNDINIYKIYSDEGISGQKENRPQFQEMIKDAKAKLFNIILVHKYDRFARKVELSQRIKGQLSKCGVNVISITEPIEDSPMGFFVSGLHELLAEYYVKNLAQEVKKGMRERVRQGQHNGSVPYGYKIDKTTGNMIINKQQANVIKKIFEMYNNGNGTCKISRWLQENGIEPAISGSVWNHYAVLYILQNVKYIGYIKHAGEVYKGLHEPIIDNETFELAQKYRKDRLLPREPIGKNEARFMLVGLARCGICGKKMLIYIKAQHPWGKGIKTYYHYYVCSGSRMHENLLRCSHKNYYPAEQTENAIIEKLRNFLKSNEHIYKTKNDDAYLFKAQIDKIEEELSRAKAAYLANVFSLEEYAKEKTKHETQLNIVKSNLEKNKSNKDIKNEIKNALEEIENEQDPSKKRLILRRYIDVIKIYPNGKINIIFNE
jgi:site-specific DNA recombinase